MRPAHSFRSDLSVWPIRFSLPVKPYTRMYSATTRFSPETSIRRWSRSHINLSYGRASKARSRFAIAATSFAMLARISRCPPVGRYSIVLRKYMNGRHSRSLAGPPVNPRHVVSKQAPPRAVHSIYMMSVS
jgi:hypothetical protein